MATAVKATTATAVKVTTIGSSVGIVLPREILNRLHVEKGDTVYLTESPDGIRITPYDAAFARKIGILEQVMRENRDVLKKLAE
ncbi:MAG: AbrB/MazE/SpoVT family DNA-binding domain-containing protein [Acidobacteriaceae bacterium]